MRIFTYKLTTYLSTGDVALFCGSYGVAQMLLGRIRLGLGLVLIALEVPRLCTIQIHITLHQFLFVCRQLI